MDSLLWLALVLALVAFWYKFKDYDLRRMK